jgi:hypothetical protein
MRRHSTMEGSKVVPRENEGEGGGHCCSHLGQLVDTIALVEPTILRRALDSQLPLLFGRKEGSNNNVNGRAFLMTTLTHEAGWDTVEKTLQLLLNKFDPK